mmetsp:Transcript_8062/g.49800  ORF Transcript_8062/g.49800 Transcript_8062/m.49800 type:complete len:236 (+) Transcript_8062:237-944(+)
MRATRHPLHRFEPSIPILARSSRSIDPPSCEAQASWHPRRAPTPLARSTVRHRLQVDTNLLHGGLVVSHRMATIGQNRLCHLLVGCVAGRVASCGEEGAGAWRWKTTHWTSRCARLDGRRRRPRRASMSWKALTMRGRASDRPWRRGTPVQPRWRESRTWHISYVEGTNRKRSGWPSKKHVQEPTPRATWTSSVKPTNAVGRNSKSTANGSKRRIAKRSRSRRSSRGNWLDTKPI